MNYAARQVSLDSDYWHSDADSADRSEPGREPDVTPDPDRQPVGAAAGD